MAESQGEHRREIERKMAEASIEGMRRGFREARVGQIFAFLISLAFLGTGAYVAIEGQPGAGTALSGMGLSGIVVTFIQGREKSKAPLARRRSRVPDESAEPIFWSCTTLKFAKIQMDPLPVRNAI
jgi:hypothetical protein